jgi:acyl carrier protein
MLRSADWIMLLFAEVLEVDPLTLTDDSSPDTVKSWDSAKTMELVVILEEALNIEFSASEIAGMVSIGKMKQILSQRGVVIE